MATKSKTPAAKKPAAKAVPAKKAAPVKAKAQAAVAKVTKAPAKKPARKPASKSVLTKIGEALEPMAKLSGKIKRKLS